MQIPLVAEAEGQPDRRQLAQRQEPSSRIARSARPKRMSPSSSTLGGQPVTLAEGVERTFTTGCESAVRIRPLARNGRAGWVSGDHSRDASRCPLAVAAVTGLRQIGQQPIRGLIACEAARTMARLISRSTSSQNRCNRHGARWARMPSEAQAEGRVHFVHQLLERHMGTALVQTPGEIPASARQARGMAEFM